MTTPTSTANNKTALRASLKKEDESLAERLAATDVPLVPPAEPESSETVATKAGAVVAPAGKTRSGTAPSAAKPAKAATVKPAVAAKAAAPETAAKSAKKAAPAKAGATVAATAAKAKPSSKAATPPVAKPGTSGKAPKTPSRVESAPAIAKTEGARKTGKLEEVVGKLEKSAREKGDKLVRQSVELLKSEAAAIEGLRAELAKAVGWAATKSDILRAGVRLFAGQKVEQMKELLASLAAASGGKKKG